MDVGSCMLQTKLIVIIVVEIYEWCALVRMGMIQWDEKIYKGNSFYGWGCERVY